jgi:UDP-2-acetamido-2,6-beta-L-arabino-hexul-4-ose reductase
MVIGNGLIAKNFSNFKNNNRFVIFASGVSNSRENRSHEFKREKDLIVDTIKKFSNKTLVYFSTCAFYDRYLDGSYYQNHKKEIEEIIQLSSSNYYIFRVPQIIGSKNPKQLLGFLNSKILHQEKFDLIDVDRNLIDLDFLKKVVTLILDNKLYENQITNISYPENISVRKLVNIFESIHKTKGNYEVKKVEGSLLIDSKKLVNLYNRLGLIREDYYGERLRHYYG